MAHHTRRLGIGATVAQAVNVSRQLEADGLPRPQVLPFAWQRYPSGGPLLDPIDLASELLEPYTHGADGLILWGDDSESASYCELQYKCQLFRFVLLKMQK